MNELHKFNISVDEYRTQPSTSQGVRERSNHAQNDQVNFESPVNKSKNPPKSVTNDQPNELERVIPPQTQAFQNHHAKVYPGYHEAGSQDQFLQDQIRRLSD